MRTEGHYRFHLCIFYLWGQSRASISHGDFE
jgi:hypothetical protein